MSAPRNSRFAETLREFPISVAKQTMLAVITKQIAPGAGGMCRPARNEMARRLLRSKGKTSGQT